jgi:hypothetical protein
VETNLIGKLIVVVCSISGPGDAKQILMKTRRNNTTTPCSPSARVITTRASRNCAHPRSEPAHFDAQLSLGMAHYRKGDFATAIAEGHKAEQLRPKEQLVHTNLSLFYMKSGDKQTAEHHGLQARIASWREDKSKPGETPANASDPELAFVNHPRRRPSNRRKNSPTCRGRKRRPTTESG